MTIKKLESFTYCAFIRFFPLIIVAMIAGSTGGLISSQLLSADASTQVLRCKELRLSGSGGDDQIILSVSKTGPKISLIGKDHTQAVILQVIDSVGTPDARAKMADIQIRNLRMDRAQLKLRAYPDRSSVLILGEAESPGYVYASADPAGTKPGSDLCVGFPMYPHAECFTSGYDAVKVVTGDPSSSLKISKTKDQAPVAYVEDASSNSTSKVVLEKPSQN